MQIKINPAERYQFEYDAQFVQFRLRPAGKSVSITDDTIYVLFTRGRLEPANPETQWVGVGFQAIFAPKHVPDKYSEWWLNCVVTRIEPNCPIFLL